MPGKYRMDAMITVEASVIYPLVIMIMVLIIQFGFYLREATVNYALSEYAYVKAEQIKEDRYETDSKKIDIKRLVNRPLFDIADNYSENKMENLYLEIGRYEEGYLSGGMNYDGKLQKYLLGESLQRDTKQLERIRPRWLKNADFIRTAHIIISKVEEIAGD